MARGFMSGALWGVVVAGIGAGTASVVTGPVLAPKPEITDAVRASPTAPAGSGPERAPTGELREAVSPQTASPGVPDQVAGTDQAEGVADTQSTGLPETGAAAELTDAPTASERAAIDPSQDDPVLPSPQAVAPAAPATGAEEPSISNNPSQPPAPRPAVDETVPQMAGAPGEGQDVVVPEGEVPFQSTYAPASVAAGDDGTRAGTPPEVQPPAPFVVDETAQTDEDAEDAPETGAVTEEKPRVTALLTDEAEDTARPRVGEPAEGFANLAPQVTTNRLPTLTAAVSAAAAKTPLVEFAEPVEVEGDKPLMSIVLVDDGSTPLGLEALESFPYPITFAVDASWAGATEAMTTYREAGFEVMAVANLPEGAVAQDAEVTLATVLSRVPEAVAVLEGDKGGLQESRAVSDQVASILSESGHGLVMYPKGLNTAQSLARRAGVPAVTLFRDFDGSGQNAKVIRRFLDQAAFKAGQEGAVIMLGRLRAETISALLIWGLQDRASRVAFVPVSQVLRFDGGS